MRHEDPNSELQTTEQTGSDQEIQTTEAASGWYLTVSTDSLRVVLNAPDGDSIVLGRHGGKTPVEELNRAADELRARRTD